MNKIQKNILVIVGIISTIVGITTAIPSIFKEQFSLAIISVILIIFGLVMLAISFGE